MVQRLVVVIAIITMLVPSPAIAKKKANWIAIPKIGVSAEIFEGSTIKTLLNKGFWRLSYSSSPLAGGNTVILGHRWLRKTGPATFFRLPEVQEGDEVRVYWNGKNMLYTVIEAKVVAATDTWIEDDTDDSRITLYTCNTLYEKDSKDRYVVIAIPKESK